MNGCSQSQRLEVSSPGAGLGRWCQIICVENGPDTISSASVQRGCFVEEDEVGFCQALKAVRLRVREEKGRYSG